MAAEAEYRRAIALRERFAADSPAVPEYRRDLAATRTNLGLLLVDQGNEAAEAEYRAGIALQEKLVADFPTVPEYRRGLAISRTNLGILLKDQGKAGAETENRAAVALWEWLTADSPAVPEYSSGLANARNNLGLLLNNQGKLAAAEAEFRAAVALQEKVVADFPTVPQYRVDLGGSYCNFGHLKRNDNSAESLQWYDKAVSTLTLLVQQQPDAATARTFLRNSHYGRAKAYDDLMRTLEAIGDWTRAIELSPASERRYMRASRALLYNRSGQHTQAVVEVGELAKSDAWDDGEWYLFARIYAVASDKVVGRREEYAARAIELLTKAVANGWKDSGYVAEDSHLDPLRGRADFRKLVADLEAKYPRPPELAPPPRLVK